MIRLRFALAATIMLAAIIQGHPARADPSPQAGAMAEVLFDEGIALLERGDLEQACAKLAESHRLDPGGGTLLNLARCHERAGRIATAWSTFRSALALARRDARQDRIDYAEQHLAKLEPRLPKVIVRVKDPRSGLEILLDDVGIGTAAWETPQPVDPGAHRVRARAPGRAPFAVDVSMGEGQTREVIVPILPVGDGPSAEPKPPTSIQRPLGFTVGGLGSAALATGVAFGLLALDADRTAQALCPGSAPCLDQRGIDASDRAQTFATGATVSLVAGAALLATGIAVLITAPRPQKSR